MSCARRRIRRIGPIGRMAARPLMSFAIALLAGCGGGSSSKPAPPAAAVRVFHAAGFTPVIDALRGPARGLGLELLAEGSGSQMACRKVTELGRRCDLLVLADNDLVARMLAGSTSWRLDFASDEMVLAVGSRAPNADLAERDWPAALLAPGTRLGRADENLAPVGYRTLLVWRLQERRGPAGLHDRLLAGCARKVDDVERLTPLLKTGELDYAFVYRSTCVNHAIRFVPLDRAVNLGSVDVDYSGAEVSFEKLKAGSRETVSVRGAPICWTLTAPEPGLSDGAHRLIDLMLRERTGALERNGLRPLSPPLYYGPPERFGLFRDFARNAGELR